MDPIGLDIKKHIPHTPGAIQRPYLLAKLESASIRKLTLVSAPPGYGKTTIVSQFVDQAQCPVVWHTVEEHERDFPNLLEHCLSTLEPIIEGISNNLPGSDETSPSEIAMYVGRYIRQVYDSDFIYILDDVHHLDGIPLCESWLGSLSTHLPRSCHMILISRTLPKLPYAEMVAHNEILTLGPQDLRLTEDEIHKLAEDILNAPLPASQRQTLATLDGWPAGVFLALQPTSGSLTDAMLGGNQGPEMLFEALARPMLLTLPPDLRNFLLNSSTLPYFTPELCEKLLRLPNSAKWLTLILKRNLFLSQVSTGFEYHNLFRGFLQRELLSVNPERFAQLHLEAAHWFEEIDDIEQAFDHYIAAGKLENAQALVEKTAIDYFGQGKFETMLKWSATLSEAGVMAPNLSLQCSMIHSDRYEYALADSELEKSEHGFGDPEDATGLARVRLQRAMILWMRGEYQEAAELAEEVMNLKINSLHARALRIIGLARLRLGDTTTAITYLEEVAQSYRSAGLATALSHLLQDLQVAYMRAGRLDEMGRCLQEVIALRRKLRGASALALALCSLGYYYHKRSNYQEALSTFEEGLRLVAGAPDRRSEGYLLASLGDLKRDLGLYSEANLFYDKALQLVSADAEPHLYSMILISLSTLCRWQGKVDEAVVFAEEAANIARSHHTAFDTAMSEAVLWLARAETENPCQALKYVRGAIEELQQQNAHFELLEVLSGCIYVATICGDDETSRGFLRIATRLAGELGTTQGLIPEILCRPSLEAFVTEKAQSRRITADLMALREARREIRNELTVVDPGVSNDTYSLRLITLGQEQVERNGKIIPISEWQAAAPRELFFYMLFNGPKNRSDTELVFWPESGADQARAIFHTTLHRARQALGPNVILFEDDLYFINPDVVIDCDAHRLESLTSQARLLSPHDARTDDLWHKAVTIYKGEFLRSLDDQWVTARREVYSAMYINALVGLGDCARARNDMDRAIRWFLKAIAIDPYSEEIYRQVIRSYAQMGEKAKAQALYYELKRTLSDELGIAPSEETVQMVRNIIGDA